MKPTSLLLAFLIVLLSCDEQPKRISDSRQNDFALLDEKGDFHRLSSYNNSKAIVLYVQGNGCPIVRNALTDFHQLVGQYQNEGFVFFMLNSNLQDSREKIASEAKEFNFQLPVLVDSGQLLAEALNITLTAEAIVLHPTTREILYRGPINNRLGYEAITNVPSETYLKDALEAIKKNRAVTTKQKMTAGCTVTRLSKTNPNNALTYTKDIAPILANNCIKCHNDYGIAPWSMTDYQTIYGWSAMIKEVILSKRMPPWAADPDVGDFRNNIGLADSNARKIINWIDDGMAPGTGDDLLAQLVFEEKTWERGEPDAIYTLKEEKIPASKVIPYRYQKVNLTTTEGKWLRGIEILPSNSKIVHHVVITDSQSKNANLIVSREPHPWTDNAIAGSTGGGSATFYPENTGVYLEKGTTLTVQIHYTTTGKEETDQTRIGLYFHEEEPASALYSLSPSNHDFTILPYAKDVKLTATDSIEKDIYIHYILPHMHYRGTDISFSVVSPIGEKKTLVSVPGYNFNWQWLYELEDPVFVPKGSKVLVEGTYDNSFQNPLNPDPSAELHYGIQSTDEMLIGYFNYTLAKKELP